MLEEFLIALILSAADAADFAQINVFTHAGQQFLRDWDAVLRYSCEGVS